MRPTLLSTLVFAFLTMAAGVRAEPDVAVLVTPVQALGRLNGQALSCGHKDAATRIKELMVTRVPKTRELGESFEQATTAGFLAAGKQGCPDNAPLMVEIEIVAMKLLPAAPTVSADGDMPDIGVNPRYLLQATNGRTVTDGDFRDRFQLITFGYTFCPDICPTTLLEMSEIMKQLGEQASRIQPIFISVDPERDTLKHMGQYLGFFDPRIIGATGSPELVSRAAKNFKVRYEKVANPNGVPENYTVDHSAGMYLLTPRGQFLARFPYGTPVADVLARLRNELRAHSAQVADKP